MPNQLSKSKKRISVAEHCAVLAVLEALAKVENLTVSDMIKQSARSLIAERAADPNLSRKFRRIVSEHAPVIPDTFRSPAKVARYKREQREYDALLQELNIVQPEELQERNSLASKPHQVRLASLV